MDGRGEPENPSTDRFTVQSGWSLRWSLACVRDHGAVRWQAVKVSRWDDRAEDLWNVWYVEPSLREVRYGEPEVPGVNASGNGDFPLALERVTPVDPLPPGGYRAEVWAVVNDGLDAQRSEVRVTVLP